MKYSYNRIYLLRVSANHVTILGGGAKHKGRIQKRFNYLIIKPNPLI